VRRRVPTRTDGPPREKARLEQQCAHLRHTPHGALSPAAKTLAGEVSLASRLQSSHLTATFKRSVAFPGAQ